MVKIAIVDDELQYMNQLKEFLKRYEEESGIEMFITCFRDGEEIVENYRAEYDIIFMDIKMQFMDGMTAAEKIRELDQEVIIMFITNMIQFAIKGYTVDALDYIVKPINYFAFTQKISFAIANMKKKDTYYLTISVEEGNLKLKASSIYYIESQGHTLVYMTEQGEYEAKGKMKDIEEQLLEHGFFRCNKGYLVNLDYVEGIRNGSCLIQGRQLAISRAKRVLFMEALSKYFTVG